MAAPPPHPPPPTSNAHLASASPLSQSTQSFMGGLRTGQLTARLADGQPQPVAPPPPPPARPQSSAAGLAQFASGVGRGRLSMASLLNASSLTVPQQPTPPAAAPPAAAPPSGQVPVTRALGPLTRSRSAASAATAVSLQSAATILPPRESSTRAPAAEISWCPSQTAGARPQVATDQISADEELAGDQYVVANLEFHVQRNSLLEDYQATLASETQRVAQAFAAREQARHDASAAIAEREQSQRMEYCRQLDEEINQRRQQAEHYRQFARRSEQEAEELEREQRSVEGVPRPPLPLEPQIIVETATPPSPVIQPTPIAFAPLCRPSVAPPPPPPLPPDAGDAPPRREPSGGVRRSREDQSRAGGMRSRSSTRSASRERNCSRSADSGRSSGSRRPNQPSRRPPDDGDGDGSSSDNGHSRGPRRDDGRRNNNQSDSSDEQGAIDEAARRLTRLEAEIARLRATLAGRRGEDDQRHCRVTIAESTGVDTQVSRAVVSQPPARRTESASGGEPDGRDIQITRSPTFMELRKLPPAGANGIPTFSGEPDSTGQLSRSFSDWQREEFEYSMQLRFVWSGLWRDALARYLTETAQATYKRVLRDDNGDFRSISYNELTAELRSAFDMTIAPNAAMVELARLTYVEGRSVAAIEKEIRRLADLAFPRHQVVHTPTKNTLMFTALMCALSDRYKDKLLGNDALHNDFEATIKRLRQFEAHNRMYGRHDEDDEAPETPTMGDGGATYRAALEMNDDARSEEAGHAMVNRDHAHAHLFAAVKKRFHDGMSSLWADVASAVAARNAAAAQLVASLPPPAPRQADCSAVTVSFGAAHRSSRNHRRPRSFAPPTRAPPSLARYFASPTGQAVHFVNPAECVLFYEILASRGTSESGLFIRPSGEGETGVLTQRRPLRSLRHSMRKNGSLRVDYAGCVLVHEVALAESEIPLTVGPENTISKAKIDSACSLTCIPLCTADALGLRIEQPADLSISNVSGQPMTIVGKALVPLSIAGHCFEQPFVVTSDEAIKNHGIILGVDFIKRARLFQDYENGAAYVHGPPGIGSPVLMGVEPLRAADGQPCAGISAISARKNAPPLQSNESAQNYLPPRACTLVCADAPIGGERDVKMEATAPSVRRLTGRADAQQGAANELVGKVQRRRSRLLADAPTVCVPRRANYLADEAKERYVCADACALHNRAEMCTLHSCADSGSARKTGACCGRLVSLLSLCQVGQVPTTSDQWQWTLTRKRMDGSCSTSETAMDARNDASSTADGDEQRGKLHGSRGRSYSVDSGTTQSDRQLGDGAKLDSSPSRPSNDVALPPERFAQL